MKEFIVTAKTYECIDELCNNIETNFKSATIPGREIELVNPRCLSRNTHYMLSDEEAVQLRQDPRVESVSEVLPFKPLALFTQSGNWDKSITIDSTHRNWGLKRCIFGTVDNWGSNSLLSSLTDQISTVAEGRNVDIVIVDGHIDPNHPEFSGRVVQYNWFKHNPEVVGKPESTYLYGPPSTQQEVDDNNHGCHVAGIAAGINNGWARESTIYNINPYDTTLNPQPYNFLLVFDYIRAWHRSKPINPVTGKKNPTVVNNSWGITWEILASWITQVEYQNTTYSITSQTQLGQYGIVNYGSYVYLPVRFAPLDADIQDAIQDGIIVVGASGNESFKADVVGGTDYNNRVYFAGYSEFYHRGCSPGAATGSICVGAIGSTTPESKANYSNSGPRVDIHAPGSNIMSSLNDTESYLSVVDQTTNSVYGKISGTSCASPQVAGIVACLLETYPSLSQVQVNQYLTETGFKNQLLETENNYNNLSSLHGAKNVVVKYRPERSLEGVVWPKTRSFLRHSSHVVFPRVTKIKGVL